MSAAFSLLASIVYGAADFYGGIAGRRMSTWGVVYWSQLIGLGGALMASLLFPAEGVQIGDLVWGVIGGLTGTGAIYLLYRGLAVGRMSVVSPLAALLSALIPVTLGVLIGERPLPLEWLGVALALPALWLVAAGEGSDSESGARYGVLAGLGFGLFFAALAQTGDGAGFWPLVAARTASISVMTIALLRGRIAPPVRGSRLMIAGVGIGDVLANVFLLIAYRSGSLALVSVLASLYPAVTVLLATVILKERIGARQRFGLALAMAAVLLIAL